MHLLSLAEPRPYFSAVLLWFCLLQHNYKDRAIALHPWIEAYLAQFPIFL
jgi:hypothetical protein